MSRKPDRKPIAPQLIVEAIELFNEAAGLFSARVGAAAHLLQEPDVSREQAHKMGKMLEEAEQEFRAIVWPEPEK